MRLRTTIFLLYLVVLVKLLFFKLTVEFSDISITSTQHASFQTLLSQSNFIPFYRIYYYASGQEPYLVGALNVVGNILLFIPLGFFLPQFFKAMNKTTRLLSATTILCLCIELLQLLTRTGQFDVDDVFLNVAGAVIGLYLHKKVFLKVKLSRTVA